MEPPANRIHFRPGPHLLAERLGWPSSSQRLAAFVHASGPPEADDPPHVRCGIEVQRRHACPKRTFWRKERAGREHLRLPPFDAWTADVTANLVATARAALHPHALDATPAVHIDEKPWPTVIVQEGEYRVRLTLWPLAPARILALFRAAALLPDQRQLASRPRGARDALRKEQCVPA